MYRIINSLATAEYNKRLSAVEIKFVGFGEASLYHETMDIAMNIAHIYDTNRWFFIKEHFEDINVQKFIYFVRKWSKETCELFKGDPKNLVCRVALLTAVDYHDLLLEHNSWLMNPRQKFHNLDLKIFTTKDEVDKYFIGKPNKILSV